MSNSNDLGQRKKDHLQMAISAQVDSSLLDSRFCYEPLFSAHPIEGQDPTPTHFLGKVMKAPFWVSSMTGGTDSAGKINKKRAIVALFNHPTRVNVPLTLCVTPG